MKDKLLYGLQCCRIFACKDADPPCPYWREGHCAGTLADDAFEFIQKQQREIEDYEAMLENISQIGREC